MPLFLPRKDAENWINPEITEQTDIERYLFTSPDDNIVVWPVRLKFNYGDLYDPTIIEEVPPVQGELSLDWDQ